MKWPDHDDPPACGRLHNWINLQDTLHVKYSPEPDQLNQTLQRLALQMQHSRRPLIWIESADVQTARAAVQLAQQTGATLHVAQSPGHHLASSVMSTSGWLGTTLAEMRQTATLVVHVGHQHLLEAPLLMARHLPTQCEHLFLDSCPESILADELSDDAQTVQQLHWPKTRWLDGLTRTLLAVQDQSTALQRPAVSMDVSASFLAERLLNHRYSVLLWSQEVFADEVERLTIERLLQLAEVIQRITRCTLLPLESDAGRLTAKECVLWLTNRTGAVQFRQGRWHSAEYAASRSLDQWRSDFDFRLCIRSLPSDRTLPELEFDAVIDAHCNRSPLAANAVYCYGSAVGLAAAGHLTRGDHGLAAYVPPLADLSSELDDVASLVRRLATHIARSA